MPEIFAYVWQNLSCHRINFFHIFHIQLLEYADGTGIFETAFKGKFMDLLIIKIKSKFMQAGRHLNGAEKVLHCFNSGQSGFLKIKSAGNIKYVGCKLGKTLRIYIVYISCPASPDSCKTGTMSNIIEPAKFMFKLMTGPVTAAGTASGQTIVRKTSCPSLRGRCSCQVLS